MLSRQRMMAIAIAAMLMVVGLVGVAAAQTDNPVPAEAASVEPVADDATLDGAADEAIADCDLVDWEPSAQELAEINDETDALVAHLDSLGFDVDVATDEMGFTYVDFESENDALFTAIDEYYESQWADELSDMSDEDKAAWNAEVDALIADLTADGITVEKEEIAPGLYDIVWTEDVELALMGLEGDFQDFEDWEPTAEELEEINAETDALAEHLRGLGFDVTIETDDLGFTYVDFGSEEEALFDAMDDFYMKQFADEVAGWSDAEKAEWNEGIDTWVSELAADGITVEKEEIAPGVYDIVWTDELDKALMELEPIDGECWFEFEESEDVEELADA